MKVSKNRLSKQKKVQNTTDEKWMTYKQLLAFVSTPGAKEKIKYAGNTSILVPNGIFNVSGATPQMLSQLLTTATLDEQPANKPYEFIIC